MDAFDRRLAHYARVERALYELQTEHEQLQLGCGIKQSQIEAMQSQIEAMQSQIEATQSQIEATQSQTDALQEQLNVRLSRDTALCVFICACAAFKSFFG